MSRCKELIESIVNEIRGYIKEKDGVDDLQGKCDIASLLLFYILKERYEINTVSIISGKFSDVDEDRGHYWNKVGNLIVDITADQFGIEYGIIEPSVYEEYYISGSGAITEYTTYFSKELAEKYL